jgi:RNA polymerase sigma-70 factor (ECF subfamily)
VGDIVPIELVRRAQSGDARAWEELVRSTYKDVYALALRTLSNRDDAAEVTQEVYLSLTKSLASFRGESAFRTWLYRVTANAVYTRQRHDLPRRQRTCTLGDTDVESTAPSPEEVAEGHILAARLDGAIARLGQTDREAIVLADVEHLTGREMGQFWGVSPGTAKVRLCRARQRLLVALEQDPQRGGTP